MEKANERGIQLRLEDLKKEIKERKHESRDAENERFLSGFIIAGTAIASIFVGWGFGAIVNNMPVAMYLSLVAGGIISIDNIKKIIEANTVIKQSNDRITMCQDEIAELNNAISKEKSKSKTNSERKSNKTGAKYSFSPEKGSAEEKFFRYVEELKEEGFFDTPENNSKKR